MIPKEKELISNFYDACHSQDSDTEKIHNIANVTAMCSSGFETQNFK